MDFFRGYQNLFSVVSSSGKISFYQLRNYEKKIFLLKR